MKQSEDHGNPIIDDKVADLEMSGVDLPTEMTQPLGRYQVVNLTAKPQEGKKEECPEFKIDCWLGPQPVLQMSWKEPGKEWIVENLWPWRLEGGK